MEEWIYIFSIIIGILTYTVGVDATYDEPEFSKILRQAGFIICTIANALMIVFK